MLSNVYEVYIVKPISYGSYGPSFLFRFLQEVPVAIFTCWTRDDILDWICFCAFVPYYPRYSYRATEKTGGYPFAHP